MPQKKRTITVVEDGKELYKGIDKRTYNQDYPKMTILGMPLMDVIKISLYIGGAVIFLVKADQRLNNVESNQVKTSAVLERLIEWTQNSDSWNSAQFGTPFKDGKPLNDRYADWSKYHKGVK